MSDEPQAPFPTTSQIMARLHDVAQSLRKTSHLGPEGQQALADLVDELGKLLAPATIPPQETAHLADSVAHLAEALHKQHDAGILALARDRLEKAAIQAEMHAPMATGLTRRLLDALANMGI